MPKIVIAAGGTAGHVVPALAVAEALRARGAEVEFIGGERAEAELIPAAGYPLHRVRVRGLDRRRPVRAALSLLLAAGATLRSLRLLRSLRADAVMGGGGYVAGPVGVAARLLRVPLVLTEADSHLGVANRMLAPLAKRVFLAFPIEGRGAPAAGPGAASGEPGGRGPLRVLRRRRARKWIVTGRPVPAGTGTADRAAARARFGIGEHEGCVLIFGGSLGARRLNDAALEAFGAGSPCAVLHASGRRDFEDLRRRLDELGSPPYYHLYEYIEPFADALAAADLVVARAGGSVMEVAAAGLPSVLVPFPYATADHQTSNARFIEQAGAAVVVPDNELDGPRLAREVGTLLAAPQRLGAMAKAARSVARPDAAERIADELVVLAG
jgi:UDP-N-acetylglucosamine--N-acetylmuramyl-(pentapeptide) pyrophosphoryl-undecaprenol N-acetylglucosamine transferase